MRTDPHPSGVAVLPGGRVPVAQSKLIAEAFLTGRLRWASDLVHGDVLVASPTPAAAPPPGGPRRGRTVQVTVGDVALVVADAMSRDPFAA